MTRHLFIVGATARAAADSAVRAGYRVSAADRFGDADLRRVCTHYIPLDDKHALQTFLDRAARMHDAPQAWLYTGGLENQPRMVDRLATRLPLCGNGGEVLARVRRPQVFFQICREAHLPVPPWQTTSRGLPRDGSWLRKKIAGSGGCHVRPWSDRNDTRTPPSEADKQRCDAACPSPAAHFIVGNSSAPSHAAHAAATQSSEQRLASDWYYQRHIEGLPASALYVAAVGRSVLLAASQQWIGPRYGAPQPFGYAGSIGPLPLAPTVRRQLVRLGNALAARANLVGLFGVDFILRGNSVWPLEINPRFPASAEIADPWLPAPAIALHVEACLHRRLPDRHLLERSPTAAFHAPASAAPLPAPPARAAHPAATANHHVNHRDHANYANRSNHENHEVRSNHRDCADHGDHENHAAAVTIAGRWCAKRIVYAAREIRIEPRHTEAMLAWRDHGPLPTLADIPPAGSHIVPHAPIATVLAWERSQSGVEQTIQRRIARLHALLR